MKCAMSSGQSFVVVCVCVGILLCALLGYLDDRKYRRRTSHRDAGEDE